VPVVGVASGWVEVALERLDEPAGDPAAFAVAWGGWLDEALRPPFGVVPIDERGDAGAGFVRAPGIVAQRRADEATALAPWLAVAAALAGAVALALSMNGRPL
jgi:hypothetical protein